MAEPLIYRIDSKDRIDFFNEGFVASARETGWADPTAAFGTSIWTYLTDESTAELYHAVYDRVRSSRGVASLAFRADTPEARRSIKMDLKWLNNDGIEHACRVSLEEKRAPLTLLEPKAPRSESYVKMCSWCAQIQVYPRWLSPEEASKILVGAPGQPVPELTHGLCPECNDRYAGQRRLAA